MQGKIITVHKIIIYKIHTYIQINCRNEQYWM